MVKHKLRVMGYKLRVMSYSLQVESLKTRVEIQKCELKSMSYEIKSTSFEFRSTSYEFKSTSYEFKSTNSRIIKSMKNQVKSLKISSFPNILSLKSLSNSWGNSYNQFLVMKLCFTLPLFHGYDFNRKKKWASINLERRDLISTQKSHLSPDNFREIFSFNLIKQNSFIFLTINFLLFSWKT